MYESYTAKASETASCFELQLDVSAIALMTQTETQGNLRKDFGIGQRQNELLDTSQNVIDESTMSAFGP